MFEPDQFFDLSHYAHQELFDRKLPVWGALKHLKDYLAKLSLGRIEGRVEEGAHLINPEAITIGEGSLVEAGAYVRGPCFLGKNCQVRHGAYIRGQVIAGDGCVIGHATEIKHAILLNNAAAGHFAYIGDSILGNEVNLGAGTKCANLRLDRAPVAILYQGQHVETGLRKFGAIFGDRAQTGCNAVTNPGTLLGKDGTVLPCTAVKGVL